MGFRCVGKGVAIVGALLLCVVAGGVSLRLLGEQPSGSADSAACYDLNQDGSLTLADKLLVVRRSAGDVSEARPANAAYPGLDYDARYDLNSDGKINVSDVALVVRADMDGAAGACP